MTTLPERNNQALIVIDVQVGVVAGAHRRDDVVACIAQLVDHARRVDVPVVWVRHSSDELQPGSEAWTDVPEWSPPRPSRLSRSATATRSRTLTSKMFCSGLRSVDCSCAALKRTRVFGRLFTVVGSGIRRDPHRRRTYD